MNLNDLQNENDKIEYKKCLETLPKSFWETYSSFANTSGGIIVLGISEEENHNPIITGVNNPEKIIQDIQNIASNRQKVNRNVISNIKINTTDDGKNVILVEIPALPSDKKPIYLNDDIKNTFLRKNEGDYLATTEELRTIIRNSCDNIDSELLNNYTIDDLDLESILKFKTLVQKRDGSTDYLGLDNMVFLKRMGVFQEDHQDNRKLKLTLGGLLFIGKYHSIISKLPHYHLDYFNKRGNSERWKDRVSSGDLSYPNLNLLSYYSIVYEKLLITVEEPFALNDHVIRKSSVELDVALREALVNMIIHADYFEQSTALIAEVYDAYYVFTNPGTMKLSAQDFFTGGQSKPRNSILTNFFRLIGASERAGTGGPKIFDIVRKNEFRMPELESTLEMTKLKLWIAEIENSYPNLSPNAKTLFTIFAKSQYKPFSSKQLMEKSKLSRHYLTIAITELIKNNLISKTGSYKSSKYIKAMNSLETLATIDKTMKNLKVMLMKKTK